MAFADHYPLETFADVADASWWRTSDFRSGSSNPEAYKAAQDADKADRERLEAHKPVFFAALQAHLEDLRAAGSLGKADGLGGRSISIAEAWNTFVGGEQVSYSFNWLLDSLHSVWTGIFVRMDETRHARKKADDYVRGSHQKPSADTVRTAWQRICESYDLGISFSDESPLNDWNIEAQDSISGDRCQLHFLRWQAMLITRDENYKPQLVKDIQPLGIVTAGFDMPSGKMMVTDVLRVEPFKDGTKYEADREYGDLSLNSALGRNNLVSAHASDHQIAFTQTENTTAAIYRDAAGRLIVTERWNKDLPEDAQGNILIPGWTYVGDFSCDVWRVMAFDRETAIARMTAGGSKDAAGELDTYLAKANTRPDPADHQAHHEACYAGNIVMLDVEPGAWQIQGGENFNDLADREALHLPEDIHIWCLLEKQAA